MNESLAQFPERAAPWLAPELFPPKPPGSDYGYRANGQNVACTREELIQRCRHGEPPVDLVWTPEFPRLVAPGEVPLLDDALAQRTRDDLRFNLRNSLYAMAIWFGLVLLATRGGRAGAYRQLYLVLALMLGVVPALQDAWGLYRLRRPRNYLAEQAATLRYQIWLGTRRMIATYGLAACIVVVFLAQYAAPGGFGGSIAVAGIIKERVRDGQYWLLLTGTLLHGGVLHVMFNLFALLALGRLIEVHGHPIYVPTIFLVSAVCGSLLSLWMLPDKPSVGASGGILGLIGFLAILGLRRRHVLPPGFLKSIVLSIALTAGTGLVAYHVIDNAAHLGGLLGGALMGLIYVSHRSETFRIEPSGAAKLAGIISGAGIVAVTLLALALLLRGRVIG